jgi:putative transcriptional regulator
MKSKELAKNIDLTIANLSIMKSEKPKTIRVFILEAIYKVLDWQPSDILEYMED